MTTAQSWLQSHQFCYGAIALLSLPTLWGLVFTTAPALAQTTDNLECLCESVPESDHFPCLLEQRERLNRAKNLARQRGEADNGGISLIETEPSMHGPSQESPYSITRVDGAMRYVFTFRVRPRATQNYTHESQVAVNYAVEDNEWTVETIYNQAIAPTPSPYADEVSTQQPENLSCVPPASEDN